jgi:pimeloyl-ACP methyl ester carboxylesterase
VLPHSFVQDEGAAVVPLLRAALGLRTLILFGHSVGGGMAVATAARFNDASVALVTESAQSFVEARTLDGVRAARTAFREAGQLERLARYHGDKARWVLDAWTETWLDPAYADGSDEELAACCPTPRSTATPTSSIGSTPGALPAQSAAVARRDPRGVRACRIASSRSACSTRRSRGSITPGGAPEHCG